MVYPLKMEMPTNNHTPGLSLEKDVSTGALAAKEHPSHPSLTNKVGTQS